MRLKIQHTFIFIIILSILIRVITLGKASLWIDEGLTWYVAKFYSLGVLVIDRIKAGHFPFYFLLIKFLTKFFGDSEFVLRFPSLLAGIFSIFIFYKLAQMLLNNYTSRLWALFIFSFSVYGLGISQEARMYALSLVFFLLWIYFLLRIIEGKHYSLTSYIISLFLFLLNGSVTIIPFFIVCLFLVINRKIKIARKLFYINIITVIPFLLFFIPIFCFSQFSNIEMYYFAQKFNLWKQILLFMGWFLKFFKEIAGFSWLNITNLPPVLFSFYLIVFLFFALFAFGGLIKFPLQVKELFILLMFFSFIPFIFSYKFETRYLFYLFPLVCLGWGNFMSQIFMKYKKFFVILSLAWVCSYSLALWDYFTLPKSSWRKISKYIEKKEIRAEEIWIFPRFCKPVFLYYYSGNNKIVEITPRRNPLENRTLNSGIWYIIWLNVKLPWVGGKSAEDIDSYLKVYLSSHLKLEMLKYYFARKGIIEVIHYVPKERNSTKIN